jgi:enhancer of mRNA-decapping protein 3
MVLDTGEPVELQQIILPSEMKMSKKYVTDDGLLVPCIDIETRKRLFDTAHENGLTKLREIECMGRCCTEMVLQLLGGPLRFSLKNRHQKPSVLILVDANEMKASYAICTARLLSIRNVKTFIYCQNAMTKKSENYEYFQNELKLFLSNSPSSDVIVNSIENMKKVN